MVSSQVCTHPLTSWLFSDCRNYKSSDIISSHLLAKWTKIAVLQSWPAGLINFTVYHSCPILYLYFYTLQATGWSLLLQMVLQCPSLWTHNSSLSCQGPKEVIVLVFRPSIVLDWGQLRMLTPHPQVSSGASCQYNHILLCLGWISSKKRITYHFLPVLPTYSEEERGGRRGKRRRRRKRREGGGGRRRRSEEDVEGGRKGYKTQRRFIMLFAWVLY